MLFTASLQIQFWVIPFGDNQRYVIYSHGVLAEDCILFTNIYIGLVVVGPHIETDLFRYPQ